MTAYKLGVTLGIDTLARMIGSVSGGSQSLND